MLVTGLLACAVVAAAPAHASGVVTVSPGHPATVKGHLQGVSPTATVYQAGMSEVCVQSGCDDTTVNLRLPKGKKTGDLTVTVESGATVVGLTVRVYNAVGELVGSTDVGGGGVDASPTQSVAAFVRGLSAGRYTAHVSVNAGDADFTESIKVTAAK
jgi:hypothetical protein